MKTLIGIGEGSAYFLEKFFKMVLGSDAMHRWKSPTGSYKTGKSKCTEHITMLQSIPGLPQRAFDASLRTVQQLGDCSQGRPTFFFLDRQATGWTLVVFLITA